MWVLLLSRLSDPPGVYSARRELEHGQLVIGRRAQTCDWVLEDPTGWISREHLTLTVAGLDLLAMDTSTNGVLLNDLQHPLPPKAPVPVRIGDRLLLNELCIEIASAMGGVGAQPLEGTRSATPEVPLDPVFHAGPAELDDFGLGRFDPNDLLGRDRGLMPSQPVAGLGPQTDGLHEFFQPSAAPAAGLDLPRPPRGGPLDDAFRKPILEPFVASPGAFDIPVDWDKAQPVADATFDGLAPARPLPLPPSSLLAVPPAGSAAWAAFCEGAELSNSDLGDENEETWRALGAFYRQVVLGLSDLIQDRAAFKDEFRVERTQLAIGRNNPLKHLAPFEAAKMLLRDPLPGFMDSEESVRTAFEDVKRHQMAMLAGVQHALRAVFDRLSPSTIEAMVAKLDGGRGKSLFGGGTDPWKIYSTVFQALHQEAGSSATSVMSVAFRDGYETFLRKY